MNLVKMRENQFKCKRRAYLRHMERLKEKTFKTNTYLQHVRFSNKKLNCLRWGSNETKEHILKKLEICMWLKEIGHEFITEAIFNNGSRADIIDLSDGVIYEVLVSEYESKFEEKVKKYPREFEIIKIK